ncbi:MAG: ABC transporter substrate-binding protein [Acidimicrobiales bacterium]
MAVGLAAAACGSSGDDEGAATTGSTSGGASATTAKGAGAVGRDGDDPTKWGVNGKTVTGPGGYTIDLSKCPANWKDNEGVTETEIRLAHSFAFSGQLAFYGGISNGVKAYLEHINKTEGGVAGKKFSLAVKDDAYEAARSKLNTDELLETVKPFSMPVMAGTPANLAIYDKLNESCVPHLFAATGHPAWSDPVNHPWTTGSFLTYPIEASIWAEYIEKTWGKGTSVAALVLNNDFGLSYRNAFDKAAKERGLNLVKAELHDAAAATVTNEMTTLASTNADVVILMTAGTACPQAIQSLAASSWKPKGKFIASTCAGISTVFKPTGEAGRDFLITQYWKDGSDASFKDDPDVKKVRDLIQAGGFNPDDSWTNWGVWYTMPLVQIFKNAAARPGGLTRTNLMIAAWSLSYDHPLNRGPAGNRIKFEMYGPKDPAFTEGAILSRYTIDPGAEVGKHVEFGQVIEQNGSSATCAWDGKQCK